MNFHFITNNQMAVISTPFNHTLPLPKLKLETGDSTLRPSYVTIDKGELEADSNMTEIRLLGYLSQIRKQLTLDGKVYLEVANY